MERLTERSENGTAVYKTQSSELVKWNNNRHKVLQKLADYEDLGLTPEQIREMDRAYSEQAKELGKYKNAEEKLNGISIVELADAYIRIMERRSGEKYSRGRLLTNIDADKWDEYKNADKQGKLLRLPCKVGDILYQPTGDVVSEFVVGCIEVSTFNNLFLHTKLVKGVIVSGEIFSQDEIGKTVFLTKNQAEAALREMEDKNE